MRYFTFQCGAVFADPSKGTAASGGRVISRQVVEPLLASAASVLETVDLSRVIWNRSTSVA